MGQVKIISTVFRTHLGEPGGVEGVGGEHVKDLQGENLESSFPLLREDIRKKFYEKFNRCFMRYPKKFYEKSNRSQRKIGGGLGRKSPLMTGQLKYRVKIQSAFDIL